ncbi:DinB family protein [Helicobacter sp. 11S02629-2]|uniref:DinB family protein n=1 Tax=Helicobacter sp. 11S02629-2 TaxID=1476195 RepID=UPI000BA79D0C|nr:DinB family protein [Helicobacter sp. 11S02629-2]PAF45839.1 hypothetical protein BKH40_00025 [Helicobacter sp. 11S02629-2]
MKNQGVKDTLKLMAKFNKIANEDVANILSKLSKEDLTKDRGLYFKSLQGTINHILNADLIMYGTKFSTFGKGVKKLDYLKEDMSLKDEIANDFDAYKKARAATSDMIIEVIESIDEFYTEYNLKTPNRDIIKPRYQVMLAVLNHATHHRGEISGMLDAMGVENDFNGLMAI